MRSSAFAARSGLSIDTLRYYERIGLLPRSGCDSGSLDDIAPDLGRYIVEFAYGDVFSRDGPDVKTREIATVAALTAMGTAAPQLKVHMQVIPHAGFPAALNAVAIARDVFATDHR